MQNYENAIVKFNGGRGALLCNWCRRVITTGIKHEDVWHSCDTCEQQLYDYTKKPSDGIGDY
jgi:hypothetical protein